MPEDDILQLHLLQFIIFHFLFNLEAELHVPNLYSANVRVLGRVYVNANVGWRLEFMHDTILLLYSIKAIYRLQITHRTEYFWTKVPWQDLPRKVTTSAPEGSKIHIS
jgi:hypothetical protein